MPDSAWYEIKLKDNFSAGIKNAEKNVDQLEKKIKGLGDSANRTGNVFNAVFGGTIIANWAIRGADKLREMSLEVIRLGAEMEQTRISFKTLMGGDANLSNHMIKEFQKFAQETPFSTDDVLQGAKRLLAYRYAIEDIIPLMRQLGDITSGLKLNFEDVVWLVGHTKSIGHLDLRILREFTLRGIAIDKYIEKAKKIDHTEFSKRLHKGQISYKDVASGIDAMTAPGGQFYGLNDAKSKATLGRWERLKDTIEIIQTRMGEKMNPMWNKGLDSMFETVNSFSNINMTPLITSLESIAGLGKDLVNTFSTLVEIFQKDPTLSGDTHGFVDSLGRITRAVGYLGETVSLGAEYAAHPAKGFKGELRSFSDLWKSQDKKEFEIIGKSKPQNQSDYAWINEIAFGGADKLKEAQQKANKKLGLSSFGDSAHTDAKGLGMEKIQSGTRNITLNIDKLVGEITFEQTLQGSEQATVDIVKRVLLTAVNDVNLVSQ